MRTLPTILDWFTEENPILSGGGVYLLYDRGQLVYVGQTGNLFRRVSQHRAEGTKTFDRVRVYHEDDLVSRLRIEGILMLIHLPRYNHALLLGLDGLSFKVWERDHKNPFSRKSSGRPLAGPGRRSRRREGPADA